MPSKAFVSFWVQRPDHWTRQRASFGFFAVSRFRQLDLDVALFAYICDTDRCSACPVFDVTSDVQLNVPAGYVAVRHEVPGTEIQPRNSNVDGPKE